MGYNARNDEIRDNITRMRREWEAQRDALATVRRFNATLSAKGKAWFWPKIGAALVSKHHWLVIVCDNCGTMVDLDLGVKLRDSEASIRVALRDVQCPRCSGYGRVKSMFLHLMFQMRRWNVREPCLLLIMDARDLAMGQCPPASTISGGQKITKFRLAPSESHNSL